MAPVVSDRSIFLHDGARHAQVRRFLQQALRAEAIAQSGRIANQTVDASLSERPDTLDGKALRTVVGQCSLASMLALIFGRLEPADVRTIHRELAFVLGPLATFFAFATPLHGRRGVLCLAALLQGGAEAHLPAVVTAFDATAELVAFYIAFGLAIVVAKVMCGRAYNRQGGRQTIALGLVLCAAAFFLPIIVGNPITLVISGIGLSIGSGLVGTATVIAVSRASNEDERGAAIGACALTQDVGLAPGALIVGSKKRRGDKNA
jgi:hypothetical protein